MYKAGKRLALGVSYVEIAIISLIILNIGLIILSIRILANLIISSFEKLNLDLSEAIKQVIEGAQSLNMPEINPLQMMVMEMIKKNMNKEEKAPQVEVLRNKDGKFVK